MTITDTESLLATIREKVDTTFAKANKNFDWIFPKLQNQQKELTSSIQI